MWGKESVDNVDVDVPESILASPGEATEAS